MASICRGDILTAGVRDPRGPGIIAGEAIVAHYEGRGPISRRSISAPRASTGSSVRVRPFHTDPARVEALARHWLAPGGTLRAI